MSDFFWRRAADREQQQQDRELVIVAESHVQSSTALSPTRRHACVRGVVTAAVCFLLVLICCSEFLGRMDANIAAGTTLFGEEEEGGPSNLYTSNGDSKPQKAEEDPPQRQLASYSSRSKYAVSSAPSQQSLLATRSPSIPACLPARLPACLPAFQLVPNNLLSLVCASMELFIAAMFSTNQAANDWYMRHSAGEL